MKISTEIGSAAHLIGEERAIEFLAKAGFDAWDFSMFDMCRYDWSRKVFLPSDHPLASADYLKFARKLKQIGLDNGIVCNQSHAPFPSSVAIRPFLKRAIECTDVYKRQITRSPIPVERLAESTTVIRSEASSSSVARRMTLPEVDMLEEMEKQTTSRRSFT